MRYWEIVEKTQQILEQDAISNKIWNVVQYWLSDRFPGVTPEEVQMMINQDPSSWEDDWISFCEKEQSKSAGFAKLGWHIIRREKAPLRPDFRQN